MLITVCFGQRDPKFDIASPVECFEAPSNKVRAKQVAECVRCTSLALSMRNQLDDVCSTWYLNVIIALSIQSMPKCFAVTMVRIAGGATQAK